MASDFRDSRLTEHRNPRSARLDALDAAGLVALLNAEDATVPAAVAAAAPQVTATVELVADAFRRGGRLLYVGAGTSGRLGVLDASECPPTFRSPPELVVGIIAGGARALVRAVEGAEDDVNAGAAAIEAEAVRAADVVLGIAASGSTPFVRGALGRAQAAGARTVLLACTTPPAVLRETCDVCITVLTGPEVVTGSTRLKAGTATKLVLNTITTSAMVLVGKTWGNLMVDLAATNAKLRDRAERIVMEAAALDRPGAAALLAAAGGEVKTALVMAGLGLDAAAARARLAEVHGHLRPLLGDPPPVAGPLPEP